LVGQKINGTIQSGLNKREPAALGRNKLRTGISLLSEHLFLRALIQHQIDQAEKLLVM